MASERIDPRDFPSEPIGLAHHARYAFAAEVAGGKRVLDVACGLGYGSRILRAAGARRVLGVDSSPAAIQYAREQYGGDGTTFLEADAHALSACVDEAFDLVVSFETIEHLEDPERFLAECKRVMASGAMLLASVPNPAHDPPGANEFHRYYFGRDAFERLLRTSFPNVEVTTQYFALASCIDSTTRMNLGPLMMSRQATSFSSPQETIEAECFVAICTTQPVDLAPHCVMVHANKFWQHHLSVVDGSQWLEQQRASWEHKANELAAEVERQRAYISELESGKHWAEEQRASWEKASLELTRDLERQREYIGQLESARAWLEEQRGNWQGVAGQLTEELDRQRAVIQELAASKAGGNAR